MAWISRRSFCLAGVPVLALKAQSPDDRLHWALLSDTHIAEDPSDSYRGFQPRANLVAVVRQVMEANVDGALICGDLARLQGMPGDYGAFRALIKPVLDKIPAALALGNHDERKNFLNVFPRTSGAPAVKDRHVAVVETPSLRLIVLDSLLATNVVPGQLGKEQRQWLTRYLAEASVRPTIIAVHHTLDDEDGSLVDVSRLFDIVLGHRSVKAILYGHSHRYAFDTWNGIHLINIPSTGYNFNDSQPVGWLLSELTPRGGAFTLHAIGGNKAQDGRRTELTWRA